MELNPFDYSDPDDVLAPDEESSYSTEISLGEEELFLSTSRGPTDPTKRGPPAAAAAEPAEEVPAERTPPIVAAAAAAAAEESEDSEAEEEPPKKKGKGASGPYVDRWAFTLNNPGDFRTPDKPCVKYMIYSLEKGKKKGTPHLQGYVRFTVKKRLSAVKAVWKGTPMDKAHWRKCLGSEKDNKDYCSKEDTHVEGPWEFKPENYKPSAGEQGHRTDLESVAADVMEGMPIHEIARRNPVAMIQYSNGIKALMVARHPPPPARRDVQVAILWGPTGTGKTHRCRTLYPDLFAVIPGRDPWDGYVNQECILFDEFQPDKWGIEEMNRLLDVWPCALNSRYFNKSAAWTRVFICANDPPKGWFPLAWAKLKNAFFRRITTITKVLKRESDPEYNEERDLVAEEIPHFDETPQQDPRIDFFNLS